MNYLTLENVTKTYGEKVLFQGIDLQISKGQKVALVAKNGAGKTTLMRVIAGQEAAEGETSRIALRRGIRIGYLEQEPDFYEGDSVLEAVLQSENPTIQAIRRYEMALLHPGDAPKKRLALAKLIIEEPEFLILDEPTNHLDLDMIEWLEEYLQGPNLTLFMVTHDRYFLERVCNQIVELDEGQLYRYVGNYSDFLEKKAIRHEIEGIDLDKNRKLFKKELEWVRRMPKARGTKAKSRVDAFNNLKNKVKGYRPQEEMQIDIKGQRLGKKILELHNVSKSFGDLKIVEGFDYKFKKKERVGVVGPNGVGKTTFLRLLTKEIRTDTGKVVLGDNTVFGYYTQSGIQLKEDQRMIDVVQDIAEYIPLEKGQKLTAAQLLERFMFNRKQQQVFVSQLSGGERRRLLLLTVLMQNPNFLILDEPTNDLDLVTLNVLEEFLMEFPGCVIIVTHDRYFMDKIVDHLFVFEGDGQIKDFNGDYTDYRELQKEKDREKRRLEKAEQRKEKAAQTQAKAVVPGLSQNERKELKRLEKQISKLEERKAELSVQFNRTDLSPEDIEKLSREFNDINNEIEEKELRWMELAEMA